MLQIFFQNFWYENRSHSDRITDYSEWSELMCCRMQAFTVFSRRMSWNHTYHHYRPLECFRAVRGPVSDGFYFESQEKQNDYSKSGNFLVLSMKELKKRRQRKNYCVIWNCHGIWIVLYCCPGVKVLDYYWEFFWTKRTHRWLADLLFLIMKMNDKSLRCRLP